MKLIYKFIYSPYINPSLRTVNRWLRNLMPGVKLPPAGKMKIPLKDGQTLRFKTNQTDYVAFCIYWNGLYNYEYTWLFEQLVTQLDGFMDIGANGGLYSLIAAKKAGDIRIIAFDPTPAANYFVNENIRINYLEGRIRFFNFAVSDTYETLEFFEVKNPKYPWLKYNLGGASSLVNRPQRFNRIEVQAVSIDRFLDEHPDLRFKMDLVKIDAEGAEPAIIRGMQKTIEKYRPIIICEILGDAVGNQLESFFRDSGYTFYLNRTKNLIPVESILKNESDDEIYNYFLVHPSKLPLIEPFIQQGDG